MNASPSASRQAEMDEFAESERSARGMGGAERITRRHARGRRTVREQIERLLDDGSFQGVGSIAGKASHDEPGRVITDFMPANGVFGRGTVDRRPVAEAFLVEEIIDPRVTRPLPRAFAAMAAALRTPGQSLFTVRP